RDNPVVRGGLSLAGVRWAFTTLHAGLWIPLTWLSLMLDSTLLGTSAGAYHVTNVLLHVANTLLLYVLLARTTAREAPSAAVAAVFAVHPLHVESVAWIAERKDVLSTLFLLLALLSWVEWTATRARSRHALALGFYALALLAKPIVVTAPVVMLLLDLWPLD